VSGYVNMRQILLLVLSISSLTTFGQVDFFIGSYSDTLTNHKLILTFTDNEFRADEFLNEGRRTLTGVWTSRDNTIILTTYKIFAWEEKTNEKKEIIPDDFPDMFISVDRDQQLTLLAPKGTEALDTPLERLRTRNR